MLFLQLVFALALITATKQSSFNSLLKLNLVFKSSKEAV